MNNYKGKLKLRHTKLILEEDKEFKSNRKLTPDLPPWTTPTSLPLRNGISKTNPAMMMMTTSKMDLFTNYPEDVDVVEGIF